MNCSKFIFAILGTALLLSCSDELKPIERETWEQREAANAQSSSSSGGNANLSSSGGVEISSSSSGAGISSSGEEQKATISGVSQKGPFLNKTPVMLYELNSSLGQTGNTFLGMTDDRGNFKIEGIELASPYALLMANGYYRNEVSGENSAAPIMLYAIADMNDRSSVNVNILTHLEYDRVQALVKEEGKTFGKAKEQALKEILAVFGIDGSGFKGSEDMSIFGESESDAALLAISILLQSNLTEGSFLDLLAEFSQKLKETGNWDNKAKKAAIAVWASDAKLTDIRRNIAGWGLAPSIPEFEKYITSYATANSPTGDCEPSGNYFCYGGQFYEKCNGLEYNPNSSFCYKNQPYDKCDGMDYAPPAEVCNGGVVGRLCNGIIWYDPSENYCANGELKSCGNKPYNPATQFCYNYVTIYDKCGDNEYDPKTHSCYNDQTYSCGGKPYDPNTHSCYNNQTYSCGDKPYDPNTHSCHNDQTYSCGNKPYDPATQFCLGSTITQLCGGETFTSSQFCSANAIYSKCGGTVIFTPGTEDCCGNNKYTLATHSCYNNQTYTCGNKPYNPGTEQCCGSSSKYTTATQFCYNSSKVGSKCGTRTETYNPDLYQCNSQINSNGIYLKSKPKDAGGNEYDAVLIGTQTWMAKNLNYNVSDSKCYGDNTGNDSQSKCGTYGRLYNWATAMNGAASSTANPSGRQGICPAGWHIPSKAEWDALMTAVGGISTAATKLKAKSGWNNKYNGTSGNGTDDYGFLALPGGYIGDSFADIGDSGNWWSATEKDANNAHDIGMFREYAYAYYYDLQKAASYSIRCVKN